MSGCLRDSGPTIKAWVVFSGQADRPWLKFLRPGFRHCFVIMNDGQCWLSFDPMLNYTDLRVHGHIPVTFDLPAWLRGRGQKVVQAPVDHSRQKPVPLAFFTCVEAVKRVFGLHSFFILTPWQLYCHLQKDNHKKEIFYG
ncbi:MAG: hypothetical protein CO093_05120 [Alphaproteobacteria bacterium CG_4_9_14_3_um_filter_47_13]|nr:MAG: hypothetical protein CO093_05120 [Alphaproteobacteria bacterium CG_4_9_14_3_um_filter_47_13]